MNPALPEPDRLSPELGDWRAAKAFWVTAFDGVPIPEPVAGHQVSVHHEPGGSHTFTTPSATALHLSAAWKSAGVAARHQASIVWKRGQLSPGQMGTSVGIEGVPVLFDFFEALRELRNELKELNVQAAATGERVIAGLAQLEA